MTERQFRYLITVLLVFPFIFVMDAIIRPIRPNSGDLREILYPVFIIPILFLAYSAWVYPQYIQGMLGPFRSENLPEKELPADPHPSTPLQKRQTVLILAAVAFSVFASCVMLNASIFTLRTVSEKAGVMPTFRAARRAPFPVPTDFETAVVPESSTPTEVTLQPEPTVHRASTIPSKTPLATAGITPSETTLLTTTPSVSPTQQVCSVGAQCVVNGIALTVVTVSRADSINTATPAAGKAYLVLSVLIENVNIDNVMLYGPTYFSVQDASGAQYPPLSISPEPILSSGQLPKGGTANGTVSFEVKTTSSGFVVLYAPPALNGLNPIRIELGQ